MAFLFDLIRLLLQVLTVAIFVRVIVSWFVTRPNAVTAVLDRITEPVLAPLRRIIPRIGVFDITPLVAIILLQVIARLLP